MLVRHREYEKKEKGWPPTPRAIDIPPETLPRNRFWNEITVGSSCSVNGVAMSLEAKRSHIDLLEEWSLATRRRPSPVTQWLGVDDLLGSGHCDGKEPSDVRTTSWWAARRGGLPGADELVVERGGNEVRGAENQRWFLSCLYTEFISRVHMYVRTDHDYAMIIVWPWWLHRWCPIAKRLDPLINYNWDSTLPSEFLIFVFLVDSLPFILIDTTEYAFKKFTLTYMALNPIQKLYSMLWFLITVVDG